MVSIASVDGLVPDALSLFERRLLQGFVLSIVLASLPNDLAFYSAPFFFLAWAWVLGGCVSVHRILLLGGGLILFSSVAMAIDHLQGRHVNLPGLAFSLLTYAPLIVLLGTEPHLRLSAAFTQTLTVCISVFVLVQALIGVIEFIIAGHVGLFPGDFVSGTFGIFDIQKGLTINQVTFTFTILSCTVFLWAHRAQPIARVAMVCGLCVSVIAQSGHQLFFFALVITGTMIICTLNLAALLRAGVASALSLCGLILAYPNTLYVAGEWQRKLLDPSISPKVRIVQEVLSVWDARFFFIGTGSGQFTSRAALFSSGDYLSVHLPDFLVDQSHWFATYMVPEIDWYRVIGESSAIAQPFFSVLTVAVEGGGLFLLVVTAALVAFVLRHSAIARRRQDEVGDLAFFATFLVLFGVMCCLIENYAELVQAIWTPTLLMIATLARLRDAEGGPTSRQYVLLDVRPDEDGTLLMERKP